MNWKFWPKNRLAGEEAIIWLAACLLGLTLAGIIIVRLTGPLSYDPIMFEGKSPITFVKGKYIAVSDQTTVRQTFHALSINMSQIAIRFANIGSVNPDGIITVGLLDGQGKVIREAHTKVGNLRQDDVTVFDMPSRLQLGQQYVIEIKTSSVAKSSVAVGLEPDGKPLGSENLTLITRSMDNQEAKKSHSGNIGFQVLRSPTKWLIVNTLLRTPPGWAIMVYGCVLVLLFIWRKRVKQWLARISSAIPLETLKVRGREVAVVGLVGVAMAFFVTLPYYTQLNRISTMGDVQRALVYRGVARASFLGNHEIGLWDPYLCGGEPLLANMESAQLDPFFLLVLTFGENLGARLSVTATLALGFLGVYLIARRFMKLEIFPSLLAATIFPFGGFQMLAFINGNYAWIPIGWIPWVVYFFLSSFKRIGYVLLAAVALAFLFLGGSLHMTIYALIACGLFGMFLAIFYRSMRPLLLMALIAAIFAPLIAVKLLPVAEIQAIAGDFNRPEPFIQPWSWIGKMFLDRGQLSTPQWRFDKTGENFRWIEYGTYVGIIPVILFFVGVWVSRRNRLLLAMSATVLVLLLMTFGDFPWTVLQKLPFLYGPLRNPQRARGVLLLFLGLVAGYGLAVSVRGALKSTRYRQWAMVAVAGLVMLDLGTFHNQLFKNLFFLAKPSLEKTTSFQRINNSYTDEDHGYYKVSYENYLAGQGVIDMCMPYMVMRGEFASGLDSSDDNKPYFGEAKLTVGGSVSGIKVNDNMVQANVNTNQSGWLVFNQNYFPGWLGDPAREVKNWNGLVAARVNPGDQTVLLRYRPTSYLVGLGITLAAVVLFAWLGFVAVPPKNIFKSGRG